MLAREVDRLVAGPAATDDLEAAVLGQQRRDQLGELVVVFGDDDAQHLGLHGAEPDTSDPYDAPLIA
jgi:hypothetical protein